MACKKGVEGLEAQKGVAPPALSHQGLKLVAERNAGAVMRG